MGVRVPHAPSAIAAVYEAANPSHVSRSLLSLLDQRKRKCAASRSTACIFATTIASEPMVITAFDVREVNAVPTVEGLDLTRGRTLAQPAVKTVIPGAAIKIVA